MGEKLFNLLMATLGAIVFLTSLIVVLAPFILMLALAYFLVQKA